MNHRHRCRCFLPEALQRHRQRLHCFQRSSLIAPPPPLSPAALPAESDSSATGTRGASANSNADRATVCRRRWATGYNNRTTGTTTRRACHNTRGAAHTGLAAIRRTNGDIATRQRRAQHHS